MMMEPIVWRLIRYLYGGYFIYLGGTSLLEDFGVLPETHWDKFMSPASIAFLAAMENTGYLIPLLVLTWLASGVALMFYRTAPLGIVLLAPVMVNIVLADTVMDTLWLWATAHAAPFVALAWHFRSAFQDLWNYSPPSTRITSGSIYRWWDRLFGS
jgi:hypothetical protein